MGGITNFRLGIDAQVSGEEQIKALQDRMNQFAERIEGTKKTAASFPDGFAGWGDKLKSAIENPLGAAGDAAKGFVNALGPVGLGLTATAGAFGAFMAAGSEAARHLGELGTATYNTSIRMGLGVTAVSQLSLAAKMAGGEIGDFETAMKMLSKGMSENSEKGKESREQLQKWGISAKSDTLTVLTEVSTNLAGMKNHWEQANAAQAVFGKSGLTLLPMLLEMSENMGKVKTAGFGMTEAANKNMRELHAQSELVDAKLAQLKLKYWDTPIASKWSIVVDWLWDKTKPGNPMDEPVGVNSGWFQGHAASHGTNPADQIQPGGPWTDSGRSSENFLTRGEFFKNFGGIGVGPGAAMFGSDAASYSKRVGNGWKIDADKSAASAPKLTALGGSHSFFANPSDLAGPLYDSSLGTSAVSLEGKAGYYHGASAPSLYGTGDLLGLIPQGISPGIPAALSPNNSQEKLLETQIKLNSLLSGPGGELDTAKKIYGVRMIYADTDQKIADAGLAYQEAMLSYEKKQTEEQEKRLDKYKEGVGRTFDALLSSGKGGLGSLFGSLAMSNVRTLAMNAGGQVYEKAGIEGGKIGASAPAWAQPYLKGTLFEPANRALTLNTAATEANTAALQGASMGGFGGLIGTGSGLSGTSELNYANGLGGSPFGAFGEQASKGTSWKSIAGYGAAAAGVGAGAFGIYSGLHAGGGQGAMEALGSAGGVATALSLIPAISKAASWMGPAGMAVGLLGGVVAGLMGNPKQKRADELTKESQQRSYTMPTGTNYSVDSYGRNIDYSSSGSPRITVQMTVHAADAKSFIDRAHDISEAVRIGLNTYPPLMAGIRAGMTP